MKLLFATSHTYLPERVGGSESSTHELAIKLNELGHEVAVLARTESASSREQPVRDHTMGYPVVRHICPLERLEAVCAEVGADWVIGGHELTRYATMFDRLSSRTCVYLRDTEFCPTAWRLRQMKNTVMLANSHFVARRALVMFNINCIVVPPLVDKQKYIADGRGSNILFINPVPKKGLEIAFAIARARPDLNFDFVEGWPQSYEQLNQYHTRVARFNNIRPLRPTHDMRTIYRNAKTLIVPSIWEEAWGRVVIEAQLNGIPVLASDRGGLKETVAEGGITIQDYSSLDEWIAALRTLDDPIAYKRYSSAAIRNSNLIKYDAENNAKRFVMALEGKRL